MKLRDLRGLVLPLLLLGAWEYASRQSSASAYAFVPLAQVGTALADMLASGELLINLWASLVRTCTGLGIGIVAGISLGALMALSTPANRLIAPLFHALRQVPMLGWIPLIALWLGNGESAKLLIVSLAALYPMVLNTFESLRQVEGQHREAARVLMLGRWQQLWLILLPAALPGIAAGVLQALAFAWVTSVGSELFLSAGAGLGSLMMNAEAAARMEIIVVCVLCIGLCGYLMSWLSTLLTRRLLRWRPTR
jgi:sulfonate transport system permease protein